jgi:hypothetical protein
MGGKAVRALAPAPRPRPADDHPSAAAVSDDHREHRPDDRGGDATQVERHERGAPAAPVDVQHPLAAAERVRAAQRDGRVRDGREPRARLRRRRRHDEGTAERRDRRSREDEKA